jgi:hypothetical protein
MANEPDGDVYRTAIKTAPVRVMSAVSLLETESFCSHGLAQMRLQQLTNRLHALGLLWSRLTSR